MASLVLAACRDEPPAPPAPPAPAIAAQPPAAPAPQIDPGPRTIEHGPGTEVMTLEDLGAAAGRRALRYRLRAGSRSDFEVAMEVMTFSAWHPRVTMRGTTEVTAIDERGAIHLRDRVEHIVVDRGRSDGAEVAALQAAYDRVVGLTVEAVFDPRGIQQRETITVPHGNTEQDIIDRMVWHLGTPGWLPEPAVGVGARWRSTRTLDSPGYVTARTTTWELTAHRGNAIEIRGTATDSGSQDDGISTSSTGTFSDVSDLSTLRGTNHSALQGEYLVRYKGEPLTIKGGTEAHKIMRAPDKRSSLPPIADLGRTEYASSPSTSTR